MHGLYLLEGTKALRCQFAEMVDLTPCPGLEERVAEMHSVMPLEVKMTRGDFRDSRMFHGMAPVEMSLLYEVLLHQSPAGRFVAPCPSHAVFGRRRQMSSLWPRLAGIGRCRLGFEL